MQISRLFAGSDGKSHQEDMSLPIPIQGDVAEKGDVIVRNVTGYFRHTNGEYRDVHAAPCRQLFIILSGRATIVTDDATREFAAGDVFLAEDITCPGHLSFAHGDAWRIWLTAGDWKPGKDPMNLPYVPRPLSGQKMTRPHMVRLYTGQDGQSHFEELRGAYLDEAEHFGTYGFPIQECYFTRSSGPHQYEWHVAPRRQLIAILTGEMEVVVSDGSKCILVAGDLILAEDTIGPGHRTHLGADTRMAFLVLGNDALLRNA